MLGCHQFHQNKPLKFEHLFSAVRSDGKELLKLSILYAFLSFLIIIAAVYVMALLGVELDQLIPEDFAQMQQAQQVEWMESAIQSDLLATLALFILVLFGLMIPLFMAYWFAPALIVLKKISALNALKLSFLACKDNFLAFLIYSVVAFGYLMIFFLLTSIFLVAIPPLGFIILLAGYMAIFAIMLASIYTAYIDIFDQPEQNNEIGENDDSSSTMFA